MQKKRTFLDWRLTRGSNSSPVDGPSIPATVPGAVQLDWGAAEGLPDWWRGRNIESIQGLENHYWSYRSVVEAAPVPGPGERVFLVFEGIDYEATLEVDGEKLAGHRGCQTPLEVDLTSRLHDGTRIALHLHPAPMSRTEPMDRSQADHSCKAPVAYGWDFHPRLIPLGLWKPAYLEVRPAVTIARSPFLEYALSDAFDRASGNLRVVLEGTPRAASAIEWTLRRPDGAEAFCAEVAVGTQGEIALPFEVNLGPDDLWWPHNHGQPILFTSELVLKDAKGQVLDIVAQKVGFRRVRLIMAPGQWEQPNTFPKSRSRPPIQLEVNGRPIFAKGSNWVCPDVFPGKLTPQRYDALLDKARGANMNMLRVWGGSIAPHAHFFDRCDALGILVWQEFPLACNRYPDAPDYLAQLDQESRSLITALRGHPCLVLWCGGNELFNAWSGMTDQSLPLRLLNRNCYELDPSRPFLPTAPVEGMGHGHYVFRDPRNGEEAWALFQDADCTAYTEFGIPAPAPEATLRAIIPGDELWPPRPGGSWELHHAFGSWMPEGWLHREGIEHYFGPCGSLSTLVEAGQSLQGIGLQGIFEEARRQQPRCSMAMNWCLAEPWPCAANSSLITWPLEPKAALRYVASACRPVLASARVRKLLWQAGELFEAELWLLNDSALAGEAHELSACLVLDGERRHLLTWFVDPLQGWTNQQGPRLQFRLPRLKGRWFKLCLSVQDRPEWDSEYCLGLRQTEDGPSAGAQMNL